MSDWKNGAPPQTVAYRQWRRYRETFFVPAGCEGAIKQARDFYEGRQYADMTVDGMPKPIFNVAREYAERVVAKICGTKRHVAFLSDKEDVVLNKLDNFYAYQLNEMDDDDLVARICLAGFVDGIGLAVTSYDADTAGTKGRYRGFLKREQIPFERWFFSDPFRDDPQDMRYLGYYMDVEPDVAKSMIEDSDPDAESKREMVGPDQEEAQERRDGASKGDIDGGTVRVFVRFFRVDGEVFFEACTEHVELFEHPHALNPKLSEAVGKRLREEYERMREKGADSADDAKSVADYRVDEAKEVLFAKAVRQSGSELKSEKGKFSRYPVAAFRPYPLGSLIVGQSGVSMVIPNQRIINYTYLLIALIMQNHAMPKVLVKPDALQGQEYDNSPNQVLTDYSSLAGSGSNGWGITKLSSGDAVNSNLITIGENFIALTRKIYGFDSIDSESFSSDTSGYAYSQMVKQMNLVLELPQKRLWRFVKENARTDLMYFRHFVDSAQYFWTMSESELSLNEAYRGMAQGMIDAGKGAVPAGTRLPETKRVEAGSIGSDAFMGDFEVAIEVEQGIAGSELTESQHFNQIWQYVAAGNISADLIRALVQNDPALSSRTRAKISASLEELEVGQLAQKDQQIAQLQAAVQQLQGYMQYANKAIEFQQKRQKATEQAAADQAKLAGAMLKEQNLSEGHQKSNNAKGIRSSSEEDQDSLYGGGA